MPAFPHANEVPTSVCRGPGARRCAPGVDDELSGTSVTFDACVPGNDFTVPPVWRWKRTQQRGSDSGPFRYASRTAGKIPLAELGEYMLVMAMCPPFIAIVGHMLLTVGGTVLIFFSWVDACEWLENRCVHRFTFRRVCFICLACNLAYVSFDLAFVYTRWFMRSV